MTETQIRQIVKEEVARNCQACLVPELDNADLEGLLNGAQRASIWQPSTSYLPGALIVPDANSLQAFKAQTGGISGAEAPAWPPLAFGACGGWSGNPALLYPCCGWGAGVPISDGSASWISWGVIPGLFDVAQASADGWLLKCAKAANLIQTSSAGQSTAAQQVFEHCERLAARWEPYKAA
jgi:hypothetical protein